MRDYSEFDDYGRGGFEKFHNRKKKKKYKGHQRRKGEAEMWSEMIESADENLYGYQSNKVVPHYTKNNFTPPITHMVVEEGPVKVAKNTQPKPYVPHEHVFGPNTHTIKGVKIDLDGVKSIERIDRPRDGRTTYGIKFVFKGFKESYRIIWFNFNQLDRDRVYANETSFWNKLQKKGVNGAI